MSEIHHTAAGQRSRTTGFKKRGGGGRFIERRHWVRWSLGQSRPFLGSWVAGADYRNVTPRSSLDGLETEGTREGWRNKRAGTYVVGLVPGAKGLHLCYMLEGYHSAGTLSKDSSLRRWRPGGTEEGDFQGGGNRKT